jgi:hypothetical protein
MERVETEVKWKIFHKSWQSYMTAYNKTKTTYLMGENTAMATHRIGFKVWEKFLLW